MEKDIRKVVVTTDVDGVITLSTLSKVMPQLSVTELGRNEDGNYKIELSFDMWDMAITHRHNARGGGRRKNNAVNAELIRELMGEGKNLDDIAKELEVSKRTLYRRLNEEVDT